MKKELVEYISPNGTLEFFFNGYDDVMDFISIAHIIKEVIFPDVIHYTALEDADGYFIKDGVQIEMSSDISGNELLYKDTGHPQDLEKVRSWVQIIWDELQKQHGN